MAFPQHNSLKKSFSNAIHPWKCSQTPDWYKRNFPKLGCFCTILLLAFLTISSAVGFLPINPSGNVFMHAIVCYVDTYVATPTSLCGKRSLVNQLPLHGLVFHYSISMTTNS